MLKPRAMNLLRTAAAFWVALSLPLGYLLSSGVIGFASHWADGKGYVAAGSHPVLLAWSVLSIVLFLFLLRVQVEETPAGVPSGWRRFVGGLIDFWFSLLILASIGGILPLWVERQRTGHFSWHFERNYPASGDELGFFLIPITMAFMFFYLVWPLTRGKQTVGCFIMRLRVVPPFGTRGAFTFRHAVRRVWLEIWGLGSSLLKRSARDSEGRTWYDRETNCTVMLIKYE